MSNSIEAGVALWASRHLDPKVAAPFAKGLQDAGQIDQFVICDQLNCWWPNALWTLENTPLAAVAPDADSLQDPFATAAFALSAVDEIGFTISTDAARRDPPELAQTMLTLAASTTGPAILALGAGEVRHIGPFGRKRSLGLKRLNETLQILRLLWTEREPVDFEGELWKMKDAFIGNAGKDNRPKVMAMGGGPRLTEMALKYADGFATGVPFVYADPEEYGRVIQGHRKTLAELGRGDDDFDFAIHHVCWILKDKDEFERYIDNPLVKWYAATGGRINMNHWEREGVESVMPLDWHYAFHMNPNSMTPEEINAIVDKVTPEMVRKTFFYGTPDDIAKEIRPYAEQGANIHWVDDLAPILVPVQAQETIEASAEICRLIKQP